MLRFYGGLALAMAATSYAGLAQETAQPLPEAPENGLISPPPSPESIPAPRLAEPSTDPLQATLEEDPIVELVSRVSSEAMFQRLMNEAMAYHPAITEARASEEEAEEARDEARSALFPTLDIGLNARRSIVRNFSNDPDNVVERSRSTGRTDATFILQQRVLDFGATSIRIRAASARILAASNEIDRQTEQVALRAIAAWYDVFAFRSLVQLGEAFAISQGELRDAIGERIEAGVSAEGDRVQVEANIAQAQARLAGFRRELENAEVRFQELFDTPAPPGIARAPIIGGRMASQDMARAAALDSPVVQLVDAQARAARDEARAARADTLPTVGVGIEGGRFGLFENPDDYDVRATINLQARIGGPGDARADQTEARAIGQAARADRVREEAMREAAIAWSDYANLERQLEAIERSYIASRQARDVLLERFRYARGTLFDVLEAEEEYFQTAVTFIQTVTELDASHYVLLSRTGRLLSALAIDPTTETITDYAPTPTTTGVTEPTAEAISE